MRLTFCGAAGTVTGSCHLVEVDGLRILLDCGLFQGEHGPYNRRPFPFDPKSIDVVLLSHAHLDHCGRLPLLVREGFTGRIVCTPPTSEIAKLMLTDSAHLQVDDAAYRVRKARRRGETAEPALYDVGDVLRCADRFRPLPGYEEVLKLNDRVSCAFHDAGHILGSAVIELQTANGTVVFSGDLGNRHQPIVNDPTEPPAADVLLVESTYGNRDHRSMTDTVGEFRHAVETVLARGGNLLIPSFALERAQEVLYELFLLWKSGELPRCRVFLDSPLAISTTRVFERYPEYFDEEGRALFRSRPDPFHFTPLRYAQTTDESKAINAASSGNVIIAGSGMCTGGRILHHLRHNLWRDDCGVLFVGYQAAGTLGRRIVGGADRVRVFGEDVAVAADLWTVNGLSSHADRSILLHWIERARPGHLVLVHGEEEVMAAFADRIRADLMLEPHVAVLNQTIEI